MAAGAPPRTPLGEPTAAPRPLAGGKGDSWPIFKNPIRSDETTLTAYEDLQFAEVCLIVDRKLQNDISACRHVAGTLEGDGGTLRNGTGVLATHVVVPQGRCDDVGRGVRQTDNEVVRSPRGPRRYRTKHVSCVRRTSRKNLGDFPQKMLQ